MYVYILLRNSGNLPFMIEDFSPEKNRTHSVLFLLPQAAVVSLYIFPSSLGTGNETCTQVVDLLGSSSPR